MRGKNEKEERQMDKQEANLIAVQITYMLTEQSVHCGSLRRKCSYGSLQSRCGRLGRPPLLSRNLERQTMIADRCMSFTFRVHCHVHLQSKLHKTPINNKLHILEKAAYLRPYLLCC